MVVIINMQNVFTTRKNKGLFFNSALLTKSYTSFNSKKNDKNLIKKKKKLIIQVISQNKIMC